MNESSMLDEGQADVFAKEFKLEAFIRTPGAAQIRTSILESA